MNNELKGLIKISMPKTTIDLRWCVIVVHHETYYSSGRCTCKIFIVNVGINIFIFKNYNKLTALLTIGLFWKIS